MSTVTLSIGPKSYTIACAAGQEAHIKALGAMIAEKYAQLGSARAPLEAQNLLFSALFLADELNDLRQRAEATAPDTSEMDALRQTIAALEAELAAAQTAAPGAAPSAVPGSAESPDEAAHALAEQLEALAARAEACAAALEAEPGSA